MGFPHFAAQMSAKQKEMNAAAGGKTKTLIESAHKSENQTTEIPGMLYVLKYNYTG